MKKRTTIYLSEEEKRNRDLICRIWEKTYAEMDRMAWDLMKTVTTELPTVRNEFLISIDKAKLELWKEKVKKEFLQE